LAQGKQGEPEDHQLRTRTKPRKERFKKKETTKTDGAIPTGEHHLFFST
jgi:hypothetical protein